MYLASRSPRRRDLLRSIGVDFETVPPDYDEAEMGMELPAEQVQRHSRGKAWSVLPWLKPLPAGKPVIGVDTMVVIQGRAAGKAASTDEAMALIGQLAGRTHLVYSGLTVLWSDGGEDQPLEMTDHAVTEVRFAPIPEAEIRKYVATEEWRGKAGAYAIQGRAAAFVEEIRGDYTNIVGLPLPLLVRMLRQIGCWPPPQLALSGFLFGSLTGIVIKYRAPLRKNKISFLIKSDGYQGVSAAPACARVFLTSSVAPERLTGSGRLKT